MISSVQTTANRTFQPTKAQPAATAAVAPTLGQDQAVFSARQAKLAKTPAVIQTDLAGLLEGLSTGKLDVKASSGRRDYYYGSSSQGARLGNVASYSDNKSAIAVLLSDEGKAQLATNGGKQLDMVLDQALQGSSEGYGSSLGSKAIPGAQSFNTGAHVKKIFVNEQSFDQLVKEYAEGVKAGKLPAEIAGKPYAEYLEKVVTKTDDIFANLEAETFRLQVPEFNKLPEFAHRPAASLAGRAASQMPSELPADLRRQLAFTKIDYTNLGWKSPLPFTGKEVNAREFHHGTTMKWMAYTNFKGDLETMYKGQSKENQTRINDFFKKRTGKDISFTSVYGPGVYTGNASVASGYAMGKLDKQKGGNPVHVISGMMNVGQETLEDLDQAIKKDPKVHTRVVPDGGSEGAYRVTRGSKHFKIKGVTTFDPAATNPRAIPLLIEAAKYDPSFAASELLKFDTGKVNRALSHTAEQGDDSMKQVIKGLQEQLAKRTAKAGAEAVETTATSGMMAALKKGLARIR